MLPQTFPMPHKGRQDTFLRLHQVSLEYLLHCFLGSVALRCVVCPAGACPLHHICFTERGNEWLSLNSSRGPPAMDICCFCVSHICPFSFSGTPSGLPLGTHPPHKLILNLRSMRALLGSHRQGFGLEKKYKKELKVLISMDLKSGSRPSFSVIWLF